MQYHAGPFVYFLFVKSVVCMGPGVTYLGSRSAPSYGWESDLIFMRVGFFICKRGKQRRGVTSVPLQVL